LADFLGLREALRRMEAQSFSARAFGTRTVTPMWGLLAMVIGAGFVAAGVAAAT
jgi:hypothetical protein